jgi:hypothetical protein
LGLVFRVEGHSFSSSDSLRPVSLVELPTITCSSVAKSAGREGKKPEEQFIASRGFLTRGFRRWLRDTHGNAYCTRSTRPANPCPDFPRWDSPPAAGVVFSKGRF